MSEGSAVAARDDGGWAVGDLLDAEFPVHLDALREAGVEFLTRAFHASGAMSPDNSVAAVEQLEPFTGGSTGRKALLSVRYDAPDATLPTRLFVKFSRDFDNEARDGGKRQMATETRFGLLSMRADFPVAVPRCLFADYHLESGSGLLISERIAFGENGIEPHHPKARDYEIDDLREHYDALVSALARLAGTHRAGRFPAHVMAGFERRPRKPSGRRPAPVTPEQVTGWVERYADFAARAPQLLPASIRSESFLAELRTQAPRSVELATALRAAQQDAPNLDAFCHWNANIDNAWFWRDGDGDLACGLMDWGNVGEINLVTALASALIFTEPDFLVANIGHFLDRFARVFTEAGGGPLDAAVLERQFALHVVAGGLQWPLGAVPRLERHVGDLDGLEDRFDPRIADDEFARTQLHLLTAYLMLWQAFDARRVIDEAEALG
ncbi:MAG TPA: hypothetical protein VG899_00060 [Mycobacteriales bacterium]|nr:hypothetical protein [Mycobacteriales bacterium]